jgi:hypothetical protein
MEPVLSSLFDFATSRFLYIKTRGDTLINAGVNRRFRCLAHIGTNRIQTDISHTREQGFFTQKSLTIIFGFTLYFFPSAPRMRGSSGLVLLLASSTQGDRQKQACFEMERRSQCGHVFN